MSDKRLVEFSADLTLYVYAPDADGLYVAQIDRESLTYLPGKKTRAGLSRGTTHAEREGTTATQFKWPRHQSRCPFIAQANALEHLAQVLRGMKK